MVVVVKQKGAAMVNIIDPLLHCEKKRLRKSTGHYFRSTIWPDTRYSRKCGCSVPVSCGILYRVLYGHHREYVQTICMYSLRNPFSVHFCAKERMFFSSVISDYSSRPTGSLSLSALIDREWSERSRPGEASFCSGPGAHCKNFSRHFDDNSMANFHYNVVVTATLVN